MITITDSKWTNVQSSILPQKEFEEILPKLEELKAKAQINFIYEYVDRNCSDKIQITCYSTDAAKPIVCGLLLS